MDHTQSLYESLAMSFPQVGSGNKKIITFNCSENIKSFIQSILQNIEVHKIQLINNLYSIEIIASSVQALALSIKLSSMGAHRIVVRDFKNSE